MLLTKQQLRQRALKIRLNLPPEMGQGAHAILRELDLSGIIAGYVPMRGELDILPFANALPCVVDKDAPLIFRAYKQGDMLQKNEWFNFMQPLDALPLVTPDIILVPMVAFDRSGARLGVGGGFYDRTLAAGKFQKIGVAFSACEVEKIPTEPHDIHMDAILTEKELIRISL